MKTNKQKTPKNLEFPGSNPPDVLLSFPEKQLQVLAKTSMFHFKQSLRANMGQVPYSHFSSDFFCFFSEKLSSCQLPYLNSSDFFSTLMPTTLPNTQTPPSWYLTPTLSLIPSQFQSLATFTPPLKPVTWKLALAIYLYT